ncbi:hypothetical protein DPMN_117024 [Dreissena polymorpha]|uniref:Uncharacterized protein n=1 Tax=Dreissena polymorpha TaxID=45954 RepID=A0A9D4KPR1_DREPO|nr:hypothetical protein DPMN_117024 [Dreissena polymorpha]
MKCEFYSIIGTNLLSKFHEDRTRNVASECLQTKCGRRTDGRTDNGQRPITKAHLSNQIISIKLLTKFGEDRMPGMAHIKLVTKFDNMLQLLTKCDIMLNIKLLTKFGEDRMKTT